MAESYDLVSLHLSQALLQQLLAGADIATAVRKVAEEAAAVSVNHTAAAEPHQGAASGATADLRPQPSQSVQQHSQHQGGIQQLVVPASDLGGMMLTPEQQQQLQAMQLLQQVTLGLATLCATVTL